MDNLLIIGAGKLGSTLYRALKNTAKYSLKIVDTAPPEPIDNNFLNQRDFFPDLRLIDLNTIEMIVICVPDDRISMVAGLLARHGVKNKMVVHTSGILGAEVLQNLQRQGNRIGSLHPLQSFHRRFLDPAIWQGLLCSFQGDPEMIAALRNMLNALGAELIVINERQKQALHLAATLSANYLVALIAWAEQILKQAQLPGMNEHRPLLPLLKQVITNYENEGIDQILSGPLQRGDLNTIQMHTDYLKQYAAAEDCQLYVRLALRLVNDPDFAIGKRNQLKKLLRELC